LPVWPATSAPWGAAQPAAPRSAPALAPSPRRPAPARPPSHRPPLGETMSVASEPEEWRWWAEAGEACGAPTQGRPCGACTVPGLVEQPPWEGMAARKRRPLSSDRRLERRGRAWCGGADGEGPAFARVLWVGDEEGGGRESGQFEADAPFYFFAHTWAGRGGVNGACRSSHTPKLRLPPRCLRLRVGDGREFARQRRRRARPRKNIAFHGRRVGGRAGLPLVGPHTPFTPAQCHANDAAGPSQGSGRPNCDPTTHLGSFVWRRDGRPRERRRARVGSLSILLALPARGAGYG